MKNKKLIIILAIIIIGVISVLYFLNKPSKVDYDKDRYETIMSIMNDDSNDENVEQEYILVNDIALRGIDYIKIKIFNDKTGEITHKFYDSEFEGQGNMITDEKIPLTTELLLPITSAFEVHDFWNLPKVDLEDKGILDGNTVYIEGSYGDKHNLVSRRCPDKISEVGNIYESITDLIEYTKQ